MNGLPPSVDLTPIIGAEIIQICFGKFQFALNFDLEVRIVVESTCIYISSLGASEIIEDYPKAASQLCELLGLQVEGIERSIDGGVVLKMTGGKRLEILNSSRTYESFQIEIGKLLHVA